MRPILPNKTEFIPHAPANEHEIFMAMRTYPDNVKVYHPHGRIDATSVFWHNKLHPNALNFAVYVDPKATDQDILFKRILDDIEKLAWKFSDDRMITRDYAPQHPFNKWLTSRHFRLVNSEMTADLPLGKLSLGNANQPQNIELISFGKLFQQPDLSKTVLETSQAEYRNQQSSIRQLRLLKLIGTCWYPIMRFKPAHLLYWITITASLLSASYTKLTIKPPNWG